MLQTDKEIEAQKEKNLWEEFGKVKELPDFNEKYVLARNNLMVFYYQIVVDISTKMSYKLKEIEAPEIASFGVDGLMDAIDSYDHNRDVKFKTWATIRIRGSVIDNIRKSDWVPRLVRQRNNKMKKIRNRMEALDGAVSNQDVATEMGMTIEEFTELLEKSTPISQTSMNSKPGGDGDDYDEIGSMIAETSTEKIGSTMLREEMYKKLLGRNFTSPERKIVYLHYYENLTMKEIAEDTGFSESRISQMHADIIRRLKKKVERNPEYAQDLQRMLQS